MEDGVASIIQFILFVIHLVEHTEKVELFTQIIRFHYSIHMSSNY